MCLGQQTQAQINAALKWQQLTIYAGNVCKLSCNNMQRNYLHMQRYILQLLKIVGNNECWKASKSKWGIRSEVKYNVSVNCVILLKRRKQMFVEISEMLLSLSASCMLTSVFDWQQLAGWVPAYRMRDKVNSLHVITHLMRPKWHIQVLLHVL